MTSAKIGFDTVFKRGDGATPSEAFASVGEVTAINGFSMKKDTVDATHMGSPSRYREFLSGLRDGGEISITVNSIIGGTDMDNAFTDFEADVARNYQIVWVDGTEFEFPGICTAIENTQPMDDKMTATFTYKVAGKPTYTPA